MLPAVGGRGEEPWPGDGKGQKPLQSERGKGDSAGRDLVVTKKRGKKGSGQGGKVVFLAQREKEERRPHGNKGRQISAESDPPGGERWGRSVRIPRPLP